MTHADRSLCLAALCTVTCEVQVAHSVKYQKVAIILTRRDDTHGLFALEEPWPEAWKTTKVNGRLLTNQEIYLEEKITIFIVPGRNYGLLYQFYIPSTCIVPARNYGKGSWDIVRTLSSLW